MNSNVFLTFRQEIEFFVFLILYSRIFFADCARYVQRPWNHQTVEDKRANACQVGNRK